MQQCLRSLDGLAPLYSLCTCLILSFFYICSHSAGEAGGVLAQVAGLFSGDHHPKGATEDQAKLAPRPVQSLRRCAGVHSRHLASDCQLRL